jgi:carbon storage regulator
MEETAMLVLTRKLGESIIINGNIKVTLTQLDRGKVRLAIDAPPEVRILRSELTERPEPARVEYSFDESDSLDFERHSEVRDDRAATSGSRR